MYDAAETVEIPRPNFTDMSLVEKFWIEFDQKLYEHSTKIEYPLVNIRKRPWAHSITKRLLGFNYNIICACSSFSKKELKVTLHDKVLKVCAVKADYKRQEVKEYKYITRKVKDKDFEFSLPVGDNVKVEHVGVSNGLLFISLGISNPTFEQPKEFNIV